MTYVGAPMIYYGDEAGMWGGDDPDERKPMLWKDLTYENEEHHPFGAARKPDRNTFDNGLFQYYKKLIRLRKEHPALTSGTFSVIHTDDVHGILVYKRSSGPEEITVIINNSRTLRPIVIPLSKGISASGLTNILDQKRFDVMKGNLYISVSPKSGVILASKLK
jgi:glycosidase